MNGLKRWFLNLYYEFYYRKVDRDVCCCGSSNCDGDYSHSYVNARDYCYLARLVEAISSAFKQLDKKA